MTYPLNPVTELLIDGTWTDITTDGSGGTQVYNEAGIGIQWGRSNFSSRAAPSQMQLELNNRDGKFSPRNPEGPYFEKIANNTPVRVRLGTSTTSFALPGVDRTYVSTPDSAALDITGDIDVRFELDPTTWRPGPWQLVMGKYDGADRDQRSWLLLIAGSGETPLDSEHDAGSLVLAWSPDGTLANRIEAASTAAISESAGRIAIRATLDVDDGGGNHVVEFFTADSLDELGGGASEVQLGSTITTAGTTSIHSGSANVTIGAQNDADDGVAFDGTENLRAELFGAELYDGIGGTLVVDPDFTALTEPETETFTDAQGAEWTIHGGAGVDDSSVRFAGEVSEWPPRSDQSGKDIRTPIEAAGILRRLGQGKKALRSAMYRGMTGGNITTPVGYWPMEGGRDSTEFGSGLDGHPSASLVGSVAPAAFDDSAAISSIPTFTTGYAVASVPSYEETDDLRVMWFYGLPDSFLSSDTRLVQVITTGTAHRWLVTLRTDGDLRVRAFDSDNTNILDSSIDFNLQPSTAGLMWLYLVQDGSDINYNIGVIEDDSDVAGGAEGTLSGHTIGRCVKPRLGAEPGNDLEGTALGHLTVLSTAEFWAIAPFVRAWAGETAAARIVRLCDEEDVPLRVLGDTSHSQIVGPQQIDAFLELLHHAANVDLGILLDDRSAVRLLYRTGLENQERVLTIDAAQRQLAVPLQPVDDDQDTRNDVTATRPDGGSARAVLTSGPKSTSAPPDGVGVYDTEVDVHVRNDGRLQDQAHWRMHLGTVDEPRYPRIAVNLARDTGLSSAAQAVQAGDRLRVINTASWLPPGDVDQLAQGGAERIARHTHDIAYHCSPASPWTVGSVSDGADEERVDTDGSQLAADADSSATTLAVLTTVGPLWTEDASEFPFDVRLGGEVVTVSDIGPAADDSFTRTETDGWGAADSGQGWQLAGGAASDYSVDGAQGLVSLDSVGVSRRTILPESLRDVDVRASVATDAVASGAWITAGLAVRRPDSSNYYQARVEFKDDGNVGLNIYKTVSGATTSLTSGHVLGSYSADERFWVRFAAVGSSLRAKLWRVGEAEPDWQLDVTDTDLTAGANLATHNELISGNTNTLPVTLSWDDLDSQNQLATVTRSVNGVTKSQAAGSDVRLAQPMIIGL